jgi:hypothetical protein
MRSRLYNPETALLRAVRIIVWLFALGTTTIVAPILLITPGRSFDVSRSNTGSADSESAALVVHIRPPLVETDAASETSNRDARACEDVMWSSLKGKCLSIANRRKHRKAVRSVVTFYRPI